MDFSKSHQIHDLREAYNDFRMIIKLIQGGYRFDDDDAKNVIAQMEKALDRFHHHILDLEKDRNSQKI